MVPRQDTVSTGRLSLNVRGRRRAGLSVVLPRHQLRLQRVTVTFNDSSENTLPFLLFCKPLAPKRPFRTTNHTVHVTCLPPTMTVACTPSDCCHCVDLVTLRFLPHSTPVACASSGSRNTLRVTLSRGLCTRGDFLESSAHQSSRGLHLAS